MDLNKVILIGNIAREPENKNLTSGQSVTKVTLATNHKWKDQKSGEKKSKADFHTVIGWNKLGQNMAAYLKKGDKVYFEGRLNNNSYEGKDGKKKYFTDVVASNMIMLGGATKREDAQKVAEEATIIEESPATTENPF
ncbi:MAG: single-stranded DNA-binding protein [Patescibacteria group bacterium]